MYNVKYSPVVNAYRVYLFNNKLTDYDVSIFLGYCTYNHFDRKIDAVIIKNQLNRLHSKYYTM